MAKATILSIFILLTGICHMAIAQDKPVQFIFGHSIGLNGVKKPVTWYVKDIELAGPGPNRFDKECIKLDRDPKGNVKAVHLKLTNVDGIWRCAEIYTHEKFGLGTYEFAVEGKLNEIDNNVVLGLFSYPTEDVGVDGTHEIDIEFSTFGGGKDKKGCYGLCPLELGLPKAEQTFDPSVSLTSVHRCCRTKNAVYFASYNGIPAKPKNQYAKWSYTAMPNDKYVHAKAMPVHINLWLFQGKPPTNNAEMDIVLRGFTFTAGK